MKANSDKSKQSNKATRRVLAGVLCGASVLSLVLSLVMPPISQAIANDAQTVSAEKTVMGGGSSSESTDVATPTTGIPKTRIVTMQRVARPATMLSGRPRRLMTREPRALRSPRMMDSLSIRSLLLQMKVRFRDFKKIRMGTRCWRVTET